MQEYETIRQARAMLAASQGSDPSERTVAGYVAKAGLIMRRAGPDADIDALIAHARQTRSASTWFTRRAALMYAFRRGVGQLLAEQDTMQRAIKAAEAAEAAGHSPSLERWQKTVRKIGRMVDWYKRLQNEPGPAIEERRRRHSKRSDLKDLPDGWREQLVSRMPKYRLAVLVNAVTGCRPEELALGVQLAVENGMLVVKIKGAKVGDQAGQPWRRLSWPVDCASPLARMLIAEVEAGAIVAQISSAKAYSGAMRAAGYRAWPRRKKTKKTVTPYCLRHAFAADMKAGGMGAEEVSAALGHCSDVTKKYYGSAQQGGRAGAVAPPRVEAARPVKIMPKSRFIQSKSKKPDKSP